MSQLPFWTTPKKVAFTVALAAVVWWLFGCNDDGLGPKKADSIYAVSHSTDGRISLPFLQTQFQRYNDQYFNNKLAQPKIYLQELNNNNMAETRCDDDGTGCQIWFDPTKVPVERSAQSVMVHEMCHMKTWTKTLMKDKPYFTDPQVFVHGQSWQGCMLSVDAMGVFREIEIDYYNEK